jgi:hypothetical protein
MTNKKSLLLVVGAGASKEADLPIGEELKLQIASAVDIRFPDGYAQATGDRIVTQALHAAANLAGGRDINPFLHQCWHIRDAMPTAISIDNFLDSQRSNQTIVACGKIAIARTILAAEASSPLNAKPDSNTQQITFATVTGTWYLRLFQVLSEGCDFNELVAKLSRIAIVCFNYDRCIEHYLFHSIQNFYRASAIEAARALEKLEIIHPYGTVGMLPWQGEAAGIDFGGIPSGAELLAASSTLRTFTEGIDPSTSRITRIRELAFDTPKIAFLGFAFHEKNLDLLIPHGREPRNAPGPLVWGTCLGISESDKYEIVRDLVNRLKIQPSSIALDRKLTCREFLSDYSRSITLPS